MRRREMVVVGAAVLCGWAPLAVGQLTDYPKRKPGLWEIRVEGSQAADVPTTILQCIDEKTDADMQKRAMQGEGGARCTAHSMKKTVGGYEMSSVCKHNNTTVTSQGVISGDFQSAYRMDMQSRFDPPLSGVRETHTRMQVRYLGACTSGMQPGDVSVNGINMRMPPAGRSISPGDMQNMKPEEMQKMIEQMKKQMGARQ